MELIKMETSDLQYDQDKIRKKLKHTLNKRRYEHTLGVAYTAAALAMCYEIDVEQARLAGLLHDCAKYIPDDEMLSQCNKLHIEITEAEQRDICLLHAKLGAYMAGAEYKIQDPEIINAIRWHTTGHPDMTMLEKIIFIADYIEPNRQQAPNLKQIRHLAFTDIDEAMRIILKDTLDYLESIHSDIDTMTEDTFQYYLNQK